MSKTAQAQTNFIAKFNAEAASGLELIYHFNVPDDKDFYLQIKNSACTVVETAPKESTTTFVADSDTLYAMSTGELDGMQAFMSGKLRIEGDMMMALKIGELFES